jgi:aminoglycoside phosphotransferase (APT) family kinase protein
MPAERRQVEALLARHVDGFDALETLAPLARGYEAEILELTVRRGDGSRAALVLRVGLRPDAADAIAREHLVHAALTAQGYPVPVWWAWSIAPEPLGGPWILMDRIAGGSLGKAYWAGSKDDRVSARTTLFGLMARLHALPVLETAPPDSVACELDALDPWIVPGTPQSLRAARAWLAERAPRVAPQKPVWIHGDFHANNVLVDRAGAAVVIDWSNARFGDRRTDLAWQRVVSHWILAPERRVGDADDDLALYARLTQRPIEAIAFFDVIAGVRLLADVAAQIDAPDVPRPAAHGARQVATHLATITGLSFHDLETSLFLRLA